MPAINSFSSDLIFHVPATYSTLQDAVDSALEYRPTEGARIIIMIATGFEPSSGIKCDGVDCGYISIQSEDETVAVDPNFPHGEDFIFARSGVAPVLATKIDMKGVGRNGYSCFNAIGRIEFRDTHDKECGVINARVDGLLASHGSNVSAGERDNNGSIARNCNFSNAGRWGISVAGSTVCCRSMVAENCGKDPEMPTGGGVGAFHAAKVTLGAPLTSRAKVNGSRFGIFCAYASEVDFSKGEAKDCDYSGIRCVSSRVSASEAIITGNGNVGGNNWFDVNVEEGGIVDLTLAETTTGTTSTPNPNDTNVEAFESLSPDGIIFGGTETQGTWTPTLAGSTSAGSHSYSIRKGEFRRNGDVVHYWFRVEITTYDLAASGTFEIHGFPIQLSSASAVPIPVYLAGVAGAPANWGGSWTMRHLANGVIQLFYYSNSGDVGNRALAQIGDVAKDGLLIEASGTVIINNNG